MAKKWFVIDTSVYLSDSECLTRFANNDIIVPLKVLEEIDKHKKRQDSVGFHARQIIKIFDCLRQKGNLKKGVRIAQGKGLVKFVGLDEINYRTLPRDLDPRNPDHIILATALTIKEQNPKRKVILVSRDINLRVIAQGVDLPAEEYETIKVVEAKDKIYTGFEEIVMDDEIIDRFYEDKPVFLDKEDYPNLYPNQFIMLVSSSNPKKTCLGRFWNHGTKLQKIINHTSDLRWGISPRNKEQSFAYDLLFNDDISFVSLIGRAGSGKTLLAIAAGLEQTVGNEKSKYKKIVISRPVQPLGKDIGFLPGTMEEKMLPWLKPIADNIENITSEEEGNVMAYYLDNGKLEVEALTYIRGRSISNAYVIIDEAQNLTAHEVKTILTRVGENTKIILTGDIEQIDNIYTNETSNGLTYAVEKFKHQPVAGHVTFKKGERSKLATIASQIL
jgi:PhoH-like ATPase